MKDEPGSSRLRHGGRMDGPLGLILAMGIALTTVMGLALVSVETSSAQPTSCGNGILDLGEDCDLSSPSGAFCPPGEVCTAGCECVTTTVVTTSTVTTTTLLNHFQCYEIRKFATPIIAATVQDQFGTSSVSLSKPNRLCAPTNKRNEDPTAPSDLAHLKAWQDKHTRPQQLNHTIVNQFGSLQFDLSRPSFLLVPSAKGIGAAPPALTPPTPDHFQCYKARRSHGTAKFTKISGVSGQDQFGSYVVDLIRPRWLCAPANKNGEDPTAPSHAEHLLCYKTRGKTPFARRGVFTTDQFGVQQVELLRRIELCVPSLKDPGVTTTSTSTVTTSTAVTTTSTVTTSTVVTTTVTTSTVVTTTSSTTTTTLYGSPSRAFVEPVRSLLE